MKDPQLLVGKGVRDQKTSHVMIFCAFQENYAEAEAGKRVAVFVEEVLSTAMEDKMVVLAAFLKKRKDLNIPKHRKHWVSWTDPNRVTIWLAVFYP